MLRNHQSIFRTVITCCITRGGARRGGVVFVFNSLCVLCIQWKQIDQTDTHTICAVNYGENCTGAKCSRVIAHGVRRLDMDIVIKFVSASYSLSPFPIHIKAFRQT